MVQHPDIDFSFYFRATIQHSLINRSSGFEFSVKEYQIALSNTFLIIFLILTDLSKE